MAGRCIDGFGSEFFIHHLSHPFTAAFNRNRERAAAAFRQDSREFGGHGGGSHGAHTDAGAIEAILIQPLEKVGELGMLGDGCTQKP